MNDDIIKTFIRYIIASIIIVVVPITVFVLIGILSRPLDPIIYMVATITGWCMICYSAAMKILSSNADRKEKIISILIFMFIAPLIGILCFIYLPLPIIITTEHTTDALFSWVFGACIAVGFELILPKKLREQT